MTGAVLFERSRSLEMIDRDSGPQDRCCCKGGLHLGFLLVNRAANEDKIAVGSRVPCSVLMADTTVRSLSLLSLRKSSNLGYTHWETRQVP